MPSLGARDLERVAQRDAAEERLDAVIAVRFARQHPQKEVDLGRAVADDRVGHGVRARRAKVGAGANRGDRAEQRDRNEGGDVIGDGVREVRVRSHAVQQQGGVDRASRSTTAYPGVDGTAMPIIKAPCRMSAPVNGTLKWNALNAT